MKVSLIVSVVGLCFQVGSAAAQPGATPAGPVIEKSEEPGTETKWYGHHVMLADLAVIGLGAASGEPAIILSSVLSGPLVHAFHGNSKGAGLSALVRATLPLGGFLLGAAAGSDDCVSDRGALCGFGYIFIGGALGFGAALGIDYFLLSKKTVTRERPRWTPTAAVSRDGDLRLGMMGRF